MVTRLRRELTIKDTQKLISKASVTLAHTCKKRSKNRTKDNVEKTGICADRNC